MLREFSVVAASSGEVAILTIRRGEGFGTGESPSVVKNRKGGSGMAFAGARAMAMSRTFAATVRSAARAGRAGGSEALGGAAKTARSPCAPPAGSFSHQTRRPASFLFRLPGEVACVQSLLPLHSATASSRLVAQLSTTAGALLQDDEDGT